VLAPDFEVAYVERGEPVTNATSLHPTLLTREETSMDFNEEILSTSLRIIADSREHSSYSTKQLLTTCCILRSALEHIRKSRQLLDADGRHVLLEERCEMQVNSTSLTEAHESDREKWKS